MHLLPLSAAAAVALCCSVLCNLELRPAGWLDRLVQHHKQQFVKDVKKEAPVNLKATIVSRPAGYVDSPAWTYATVIKLLTLIRHSEGSKAVRAALRRALAPTRRTDGGGDSTERSPRQKSFKLFPSLSVDHPNYMYYPIGSASMEYSDITDKLNVVPSEVVIISNPVEAHMPAAQISVQLLKDILESRAKAARVMPSTTRVTILWHSTTKTPATAAGNDSATATTAAGGGEGANGTAAGGDNPAGSDAPEDELMML